MLWILVAAKDIIVFFLARKGFKVDAIDIKKEYIDYVKKITQKYKLNINASLVNIKDFKIESKKYNLVLAIQSLPFLTKSELKKVINEIKNGLKSNGVLIISSFTIKDPSFLLLKKNSKLIEENTFEDKNHKIWCFFKKNELKTYFDKKFKFLFYKERLVKDKFPHPHSHGIVETVIKKA